MTAPEPDTVVGPVHLPLRTADAIAPFELWYFSFGGERWAAAFTGTIRDGDPVPLRIESACLFGHVFHSAKCDCGYQLDEALAQFGRQGRGLVIYAIDQDARGLGIEAHFRIYVLRQQENLDTEAVYERLQAPVDARSYDPVATILRHLGVGRVRLLSNNPARRQFLLDYGFEVETVAIEAPLDEHNMSTLMLEKEDLGYTWSFRTHGDWLAPLQARIADAADRHAALLVDDTTTAVGEAESTSWNLAHRLASDPPPPADHEEVRRVLYLTDFPRRDELPIYRALGASFAVVPFAEIPDWLYAAGAEAGIRIQDWGRQNAYERPRPQWNLIGTIPGFDVYHRGPALRCVYTGDDDPSAALDRLLGLHRIARAVCDMEASGPSQQRREADGPAWAELPALPMDEHVLRAHGLHVASLNGTPLVTGVEERAFREAAGRQREPDTLLEMLARLSA